MDNGEEKDDLEENKEEMGDQRWTMESRRMISQKKKRRWVIKDGQWSGDG